MARIEEQARRALASTEMTLDPLLVSIDTELSMLLEHLDRFHAERARTDDVLDRAERATRLELQWMDQSQWWYHIHREERWRDHQRLRQQQIDVELQRVRTDSGLEQRLNALHDRIAVLLIRRTAITGDRAQ